MNFKIKYLTIPIQLLAISFSVQSQIITIVGEPSNEPVENVALFNSARSLSTLSGKDGKANISIFKENDSIFFQHPTYNMLVFRKKELEGMKKVQLSRRIILIDEFVISASKYVESKRDVPFKVDVLDESSLIRYQEQS